MWAFHLAVVTTAARGARTRRVRGMEVGRARTAARADRSVQEAGLSPGRRGIPRSVRVPAKPEAAQFVGAGEVGRAVRLVRAY